jgi:nucleoside-diphosphate-sugar epimerase
MNVFVTGATGFLGKNFVKKLACDSRINKIYLLVRKPLAPRASGRIEYITGDLDSIKNIVLGDKIDAVVHLAAAIRSDDPTESYRVNVDGTRNVVDFCNKNKIGRLVFTSSVNVYLKHKGAYSKDKLLAEDTIKAGGLKYCIFRVGLVYGPTDPTLCRLIDFIRKYHIAPVFGDGKKLKQPVYIEEVTDFLRNALFLNRFDYTVDIAGKNAVTYNEMLKLLCRVLNQKAFLFHIPVRLLVTAIEVFKKIGIRIPLNVEQIYHTDENLSFDMSRTAGDFAVKLDDMGSNLKKYIVDDKNA